MDLLSLQKNWDDFGKTDPLWAILTDPTKRGGKWNLDEFLQTGVQEIAEVFKYLETLEVSLPSNRALDFGCGVGRLTQALSSRFDQCWGVDIAPSMIEFAKKLNRFPDRCRYYLNEKSDLSFFPAEHFDFIYSKLVLQHMDQAYSKAYIKEFLRILSPDGVLIFQIPDGPARPPIDDLRRSKLTKALPPDAFKARIVFTAPTRSVEAGGVTTVHATVQNVSKTSWPRIGDWDGMYFVRLGNHWLDAGLKLLVNDDTRANLPSDLEPGGTADLVLHVTAPAAPGEYVLELDMVQEGVAWFAHHGSETARTTISVTKGSAEPPARTAAVMEMHTVPQSEVSRIIGNGGGEIIDMVEDGSSGPDFLSFSYCVKKRTRDFVKTCD